MEALEEFKIISPKDIMASCKPDRMTQRDLMIATQKSINDEMSVRKIRRIIQSYQDCLVEMIIKSSRIQPIRIHYPDLIDMCIVRDKHKIDFERKFTIYNDYLIDMISKSMGYRALDVRLVLDNYYENLIENVVLGVKTNFMSLVYISLEEDKLKCSLSSRLTRINHEEEGLKISLRDNEEEENDH